MLFIDEVHRLAPAVEEILYPALEDFRLDIVVGQGPSARTLALDLPPFTLVGATTRTGLLTTPLRDRFGMTFRLGYYEHDGASDDRAPLGTHPRRRDRGRGGRRDRPALARYAARGEPHPPAGARRGRGAARRRDHAARSPTRRWRCSRSTSKGLERIDRELLARGRREVRGRAGRPVDARRDARRGARHDRGRLRAVPAPARLHPADACAVASSRSSGASTSGRRRSTGRSSEPRALGPGRARSLRSRTSSAVCTSASRRSRRSRRADRRPCRSSSRTAPSTAC